MSTYISGGVITLSVYGDLVYHSKRYRSGDAMSTTRDVLLPKITRWTRGPKAADQGPSFAEISKA
ncbi:hypothetical protein CY34DRAFT_811528 [Suillus luteus UH-Slu-Lm8-n1]|uniref:Uncharacterized protein n=1 Tax=Suillus luteus UH-Slu-Lm8-n1 TaxID=930992 RepID=A0A0D0AW79_9AGAM|nr:hypothetical protein CY34DRAFT_811528 [Suillus luteus UH-Slu-Lm8-n1]